MPWRDDEEAISLREARHRVTNVFQLLGALGRLRAQRVTGEEARRQLNWLQEAINTLGVLQRRQLSPGGDDFGAFLADMVPHWRRKAPQRQVAIEVAAEQIGISEQAAAALALIVQELVVNAITHGFPGSLTGTVSITLERADGQRAALRVVDNGVGYGSGATGPDRLGLWLIKGLVEQLGGVLRVESAVGVDARIEFPLT